MPTSILKRNIIIGKVGEKEEEKDKETTTTSIDGNSGSESIDNNSGINESIIDSQSFSQNDLEFLNKLLKKYEGTHSFHNFTTKVKNTDPSAKRHMVDLNASEPFKINEKEYVSISIYGGSFMLHQIRRMMGLIIGIMRGHVNEHIIEKAMNDKYYVNIPEAPGHCLILLNQEFPGYDQVRLNDDIFKPLIFDESKEKVLEFRKKIFIEIENLDDKNLM